MGRGPSADGKLMRDDIKSFFISNPNVWVTGNDLIKRCGLNMKRSSLTYHINRMINNGEFPGELINGQDGLMFVPKDRTDEPAIEEPADKFVSPWVNHEGYSDPTAKKALDTACRFHEGEVWEVQKNDGNTELVLIVKAYESKLIAVPIFESKEYNITEENKAYTSYIQYNDVYRYFLDRRCLRPKPAKYFLEFQFSLTGSEYTKITTDISRMFRDEDVVNRIDILEKQANKYRSMINSLRVEKGNAERAVDVKEELIRELKISLKNLSDENESLKSRITKAEPEPVNDVQMLLMAQKIDIYEKLLKISWEG